MSLVERARSEAELSAVAPKGSRPQPLTSLGYRNYRLLWLSQLCSSSGHWMDQVTRGYLVYQLTGSAIWLGTVTALRALPILFFGVLGGVLADRFDRKLQLIGAQVANLFLNLILAGLIFSGRIEIWHLLVTAVLAGTAQSFQQPARQALIANLVPRKDLMNAIALNAGALNVSRTVGPAVAGMVIGVGGAGWAYLAEATLYLVSAIWTVQILMPRTLPSAREESIWSNLVGGLRYVGSNTLVLSLLVIALIPMLLGQPYISLMPIFAEDVLNIGPTGLGLLLSAPGVGAVTSILLLAALGDFRRKGTWLLMGAGAFGLALVAFSLSRWLPLTLLFLVGVGMAHSGYHALVQTLLHANIPDSFRGRVMSIYLLDRGLSPLGALLLGALADLLGAQRAVAIGGALCALLTLWVSAWMPHLRRLS